MPITPFVGRGPMLRALHFDVKGGSAVPGRPAPASVLASAASWNPFGLGQERVADSGPIGGCMATGEDPL